MSQATWESFEKATEEKTLFGFWVYLMTDCLLFGTLFAIYLVLHGNTNGGPSGRELFDPFHALLETLVLLTSSFTCAMANLAAQRQDKNKVLLAFAATFLLGAAFLALELTEFTQFYKQGNSWQRSGFLSAFFILVGTHGLHIVTGLLWMVLLLVPVFLHGLTPVSLKRLKCLRLFWHFLDVVWIFIFTIVYLMGIL